MLTAPPKELELQKKEKMQKLLEMLLKDYVKKSIRGSNLNIKDSSDLPMILKDIRGNLKQETREGYNLIDIWLSKNLSNCSIIDRTNSSLKVVVLDNTKESMFFIPVSLVSNQNYTFKMTRSNATSLVTAVAQLYDANTGTWIWISEILNTTQTKNTFTVTSDGEYVIRILVKVNPTTESSEQSITLSDLILYEGTEDNPYEQYGVSPSIYYPSPVKYVTGEFESYNKLNVESVDNSITDDFTITNNKDGTITINGVLTKSHQYSLSDVPLTYKNDKARFSFEVISGSANITSGGQFLFIFYGGKLNEIDPVIVRNNVTDKYSEVYNITTKETTQRPYFHFGWLESVGGFAEFNNYRIRLQVTEGTEDKAFLPYGTIKNTYEVKVQNKNLLYLYREDGFYAHTTGAFVTNIRFNAYIAEIKPNQKYWAKNIHSNLVYWDKNMKYISSLTFQGGGIFTPPDNAKYATFAVDKTANINPIVVLGDVSPKDYIPHQETIKNLDIPEEYALYGEEDYFYKKLGKWYVHNEYSKVALKELDWITSNTLNDKTRYVTHSLEGKILGALNNDTKVKNAKCTILSIVTAGQTYSETEGLSVSNSGFTVIFIDDLSTEITTDKFMELLENTNAYLVYQLQKPIEIEITNSEFIKELEALLKLQSYYPETNISVEKLVENEETELPILDIDYLIGMKQLQNQIDELNKKISQEE